MRVSVFRDEFPEDIHHWAESGRRITVRVLDLVGAVMRNPFRGIGKSELLKHMGANIWSRRISREHRPVYLVRDERIDFVVCRYHY